MSKDAYHPIANYGVIGDCHTVTLISNDGSIDWLCSPRFDSPSLFAALLDAERGGQFVVRPAEPFTAEVAYIDYSAVLQTTFRTDCGVVTLTDFMPLRPGSGSRRFAYPESQHRLVRLIECREGEVPLDIDFSPRPNYARTTPVLSVTTNSVALETENGDRYRLHTSVPLAIEGPSARGVAVVRRGERIALVLELSDVTEGPQPDTLFGALQNLADTLAFWSAWASGCRYRGPYQQAVMRSAVTLKLLTYVSTGAMVAAPTTSLPEEIGGVRNWDYRYTWIRDASFAAYALFLAGHIEDGERFMEWICEIALHCEPGQLQIMYGLAGERDLPETTLDHLVGYRGSGPVRVGNGASMQFQLDVYGELLDCFHTCRRFGQFSAEKLHYLWPAFAQQVDLVAERWREPDSGIWEVRSAPRHFVYSKVMSWVALDRGIKAAEELALPADIARWRAERDAVRMEVLDRGYDPALGAFARSYGERALDAANLLLPMVHFIDARDPHMRSTIEATERGLVVDGLVYRYLDVDDGLPGGEATFGVCTFWLVDNLTALGRIDEATMLFERMLDRATPLGLYAEELDPRTGAHLGNFPQALTHIGLINAAVNLGRADTPDSISDNDGQARDITGAVL